MVSASVKELEMGMRAKRHRFEDLKIGDQYRLEEVIEIDKVDGFAAITGDYNPIHMDNDFAGSRGFKKRVVHGAFLAGLLSRIVGMDFPGESAIIHSMNLRFHHPAYIGDQIRIVMEIDQISPANRTIVLKAHTENTISRKILLKGKIQVGFTG